MKLTLALLFILFFSAFSFAANIAAVSVSTDKPDYTAGENILATVSLTGQSGTNVSVLVELVKESQNRAVVLNQAVTGTVPSNLTLSFPTTDLSKGVYSVRATITSTGAAVDDFPSDNRASSSITLQELKATAAPEIHPILAVFVVLTVIFLLNRQ